jgi:hypothetical protein
MPCGCPSGWSWRSTLNLYARIEELSIRSGRSIPEIIQGLISCAFPINPAETVLGESIS